MIMRLSMILGLLLAASCSAPSIPPKSLCDLPRSLRTWEHTQVRWRGAIIGGFNHGFSLIAEDCPRRGIVVADWPEHTPDGRALQQELEKRFAERGVLRVEVSGRVTSDRTLIITKVHHFDFQPMTEAEDAAWWRTIRF